MAVGTFGSAHRQKGINCFWVEYDLRTNFFGPMDFWHLFDLKVMKLEGFGQKLALILAWASPLTRQRVKILRCFFLTILQF